MKTNNWKDFVIKYLKQICCIILIGSLFIGVLFTYGEKRGRYADNYGIAGYHLIFDTSTIYAILLLLVPLLLLFINQFEKLNEKARIIEFVAPMISLAVLIVIKFNLRDAVGLGNAAAASYAVSFSSGFGLSGWVYVIGSLILICLGAINYFGFKVNQETIKRAISEKNLDALKKEEEEEEEK